MLSANPNLLCTTPSRYVAGQCSPLGSVDAFQSSVTIKTNLIFFPSTLRRKKSARNDSYVTARSRAWFCCLYSACLTLRVCDRIVLESMSTQLTLTAFESIVHLGTDNRQWQSLMSHSPWGSYGNFRTVITPTVDTPIRFAINSSFLTPPNVAFLPGYFFISIASINHRTTYIEGTTQIRSNHHHDVTKSSF